ncbi:hypothetical protein NVP1123O_63 [Vibrio phage 1.123.O._10N.286.48.F3]|nr:hypothetical protein NVP1123O_63 [Vibrio phage 1.123.O._10N.286.48.F3]
MQTKIIIKPQAGSRWHEIAVSLFDVDGNPVANVKSGTASGKGIFTGSKHYSHFENTLDLKHDGRWSPFYGDLDEIVVDIEHAEGAHPHVIANSWEQKS